MILDSSAVMAIFFQEPEYQAILTKLVAADEAGIGAPTLVECAIVLTARMGLDARGLLAHFIREAGVTVIPFTEVHGCVSRLGRETATLIRTFQEAGRFSGGAFHV